MADERLVRDGLATAELQSHPRLYLNELDNRRYLSVFVHELLSMNVFYSTIRIIQGNLSKRMNLPDINTHALTVSGE